MIINKNKISLITSQTGDNLRRSLRESNKPMNKTHIMNSKIRFLTERDEESPFEDFQSGRKIIDELPEVRPRGRPSLYHHVFNFISTDKHREASRVKRKLSKHIIQNFNSQTEIEPWSSGIESRSIYTHFLKRNSTQYIESQASQRGYSLIIPSLQRNHGKSHKLQIFKRKSVKSKHEKIPKLKHGPSKSQIRRQRSQITELIKIEKKQIKDVRVNKIVIHKSKFFNVQPKQQREERISSRIQPWGIHHHHHQLDSF